MFFLGADQGIKMNSERLISTDQHTFTYEAWKRFALWTPVESRDQEPRNGVIKDDFHQSNKRFYRRHVQDYPLL